MGLSALLQSRKALASLQATLSMTVEDAYRSGFLCAPQRAEIPFHTNSAIANWQAANELVISPLEARPYVLVPQAPLTAGSVLPSDLRVLVGEYQAAALHLLRWFLRQDHSNIKVEIREDKDHFGHAFTIPYIEGKFYRQLAFKITSKVPPDVADALETNIYGRITVHEWHERLPAHDARVEKNARHAAHIDVLRDVGEILRTRGLLCFYPTAVSWFW